MYTFHTSGIRLDLNADAECGNCALFWNESNGVQCACFVNNDQQSASVNRCFLKIFHT